MVSAGWAACISLVFLSMEFHKFSDVIFLSFGSHLLVRCSSHDDTTSMLMLPWATQMVTATSLSAMSSGTLRSTTYPYTNKKLLFVVVSTYRSVGYSGSLFLYTTNYSSAFF